MQYLKLLMLCWRSFSGCGREHVAVVSASKSCQYLINGCLQPIGASITQDAKLKIVDSVDAHCKNGVMTMLLSLSSIQAANTSIMNTYDEVTCELPYIQDHKLLTLC